MTDGKLRFRQVSSPALSQPESEGARTCAIELRSFSKNAGFTGLRLGFAVVPKDLVIGGTKLNSLWARRHGTKYKYLIKLMRERKISKDTEI